MLFGCLLVLVAPLSPRKPDAKSQAARQLCRVSASMSFTPTQRIASHRIATNTNANNEINMALPPSSPRLPSPPPPTEIQIGPKSPSLGGSMSEPTIEQSTIDANAKRRIHPGTKSADMAAGPPLVPLNEVNFTLYIASSWD